MGRPCVGLLPLGWNTWYYCVVTLCAEIAAVAVVIQYWPGAEGINVAAWISISIVVVTGLNLFAVSVYGEAEFIFASIKIVTIVGLIILALIIDLGGAGNERIGFRYWRDPGAMKEYVGKGDLGRFLGFFSTLVNAAFSFGGIETVAVAGGEAENPRRNIPKAVRRVFWRILFFYVLGALAIGMTVPHNDANLLSAQANGAKGAAASPWVIAISRANIKVLPSIINAVILSSAASSANAMTFNGSRYLYALASNGQAPQIFLKCNKDGVPWVGVLSVATISLLSFLSCSSSSSVAFTWFQNLATLSSLFTWVGISLVYVRFHGALRAQGIDRDSLVFKAPFQPYLAYFSMVFFSIIIIFNGFYTFAPWDVKSFITSYLTIPLVLLLFLFWKIYKKTEWVPSSEADLYTDKAAIDALIWEERKPRNWVEKFWDWLGKTEKPRPRADRKVPDPGCSTTSSWNFTYKADEVQPKTERSLLFTGSKNPQNLFWKNTSNMTTTKSPSEVLPPIKLAHVVFKTAYFTSMVAWYKAALGAHATYENPGMAFLTYDYEHHHVAIANIPGCRTSDNPMMTAGMEHVAFTYPTLRDMVTAYKQRKARGILPVDAFDTVEDANAYFQSPAFAENPIGVDFDPEELARRVKNGEDEKELLKRPNIGPRGIDTVPVPPKPEVRESYEPVKGEN
ncbi:hypothetical protein NM208_g4152 [Fusarium decemcellulare]|uniref:Uncharacterized protein n=1 Tax=Fusarium decemcellulare TaxID=57161 RepID=A0ACC1SLS7_9HYPO|nr:hypothetical protein NM208_g4152 [Fusarium decemcellulare]